MLATSRIAVSRPLRGHAGQALARPHHRGGRASVLAMPQPALHPGWRQLEPRGLVATPASHLQQSLSIRPELPLSAFRARGRTLARVGCTTPGNGLDRGPWASQGLIQSVSAGEALVLQHPESKSACLRIIEWNLPEEPAARPLPRPPAPVAGSGNDAFPRRSRPDRTTPGREPSPVLHCVRKAPVPNLNSRSPSSCNRHEGSMAGMRCGRSPCASRSGPCPSRARIPRSPVPGEQRQVLRVMERESRPGRRVLYPQLSAQRLASVLGVDQRPAGTTIQWGPGPRPRKEAAPDSPVRRSRFPMVTVAAAIDAAEGSRS